jgi:hypothetical protein
MTRLGGWNAHNIVERPEAVKARRLRPPVMPHRVMRSTEKAGKSALNPAGCAYRFYAPPVS